MDIVSIRFVIITILSIFVFYLIYPKYRIVFLTILSCGFIASFNYLLLPYIILYVLINYYIGLKLPDSRNKKALYITGLVLNLTQLILLRYASFTLDPIFNLLNSDIHISKLSEILVPIGISYFTLQGIGYLINVKMGWEKPENKFFHFLLYITFFPKFISGPIERSNHFLPQLNLTQKFNYLQVNEGLRIAFFGFFKKVAIANQLAPFLNVTYANLNSADGLSLWLLLFIQPLYLYFDFSGYTDIAIGIAKTFGIKLLPNFNRPFFSENMTTFWKRFHISLSSWFNDYIFKQTCFKYRKWGIKASIYAMFITWVLFGIWHGAGWNFMFLGCLQAIAIIFEFFTKKWRLMLFAKFPVFISLWLGRFITYFFYACSLVFFFSPNISSSFTFYKKLLNVSSSEGVFYLEISKSSFFLTMILIMAFLIIEAFKNDLDTVHKRLTFFIQNHNRKIRFFRWTLYYILLLLIFYYGSRAQDFVYFQF